MKHPVSGGNGREGKKGEERKEGVKMFIIGGENGCGFWP
jgi:hypothetical protein